MMICKHRIVDKCKKDGRPCIFSEKCFEPEEQKPMTNADHIRSMSDEDLEVFLCGIAATNGCMGCMVSKYCSFGKNGMKYWLKQPFKEKEE